MSNLMGIARAEAEISRILKTLEEHTGRVVKNIEIISYDAITVAPRGTKTWHTVKVDLDRAVQRNWSV